MYKIKAKCNQDLFPVWSKYKRSFWKGNVYSFEIQERDGEKVFACDNNSLNTTATMSESLFKNHFTIIDNVI
jgi:hypothetical protein